MAPSVGLGRSLRTKLKLSWYANVTPNAGTGIFTGYVYPGSCFDPTGDITTHQAPMFDQLKLIYARYLVTGATLKISAQRGAEAAVSQAGFVIAAYPSTVTTPVATFQDAASRPYGQSKLYGNGSEAVNMYFKMDAQKIVGSRLPVIAEDCGALISSNPATGQNIVVPIFIQNFTVSAAPVTLHFTLVQDVIFDQMINVADA